MKSGDGTTSNSYKQKRNLFFMEDHWVIPKEFIPRDNNNPLINVLRGIGYQIGDIHMDTRPINDVDNFYVGDLHTEEERVTIQYPEVFNSGQIHAIADLRRFLELNEVAFFENPSRTDALEGYKAEVDRGLRTLKEA